MPLPKRWQKKYFGSTKAIGQTFSLYPGESFQRDLKVAAIVKNPPLNSSIYFGFLMSFDNYIFDGKKIADNDWSWLIDATFYQLNNPNDAPNIAQQLNEFVAVQNAAREDWKIKAYELEPMSTIAHSALHMFGTRLQSSLPESAVWGPSLMAILLLLTTCLNFANTTVAFSSKRLKEMGVRKVMGGSQAQIVGQLLSECLFICLMALGIALVFTELLVPLYNDMWLFLELESQLSQQPSIDWLFDGNRFINRIFGRRLSCVLY